MKTSEGKILEEIVNSREAVEIVNPSFDQAWPKLRGLVQVKLKRLLTADEDDTLYRDLRDWWKNGNFRVWRKGEENAFGMTGWEFGDPDFWRKS